MTRSCAWCGGEVPKARGRTGRRVFCQRGHKEEYFREALRIGLEALDRADAKLDEAARTEKQLSASAGPSA